MEIISEDQENGEPSQINYILNEWVSVCIIGASTNNGVEGTLQTIVVKRSRVEAECSW